MRWPMAEKVPPASISGSWRGSPTRTSFERVRWASSMSWASWRVPTMPASSTTRTVRSSR